MFIWWKGEINIFDPLSVKNERKIIHIKLKVRVHD